MYTVAALYKFVSLSDYKSLKPMFEDFCHAGQIKGTLILAEEGINGTVAGPDKSIEELHQFILSDKRFQCLSFKTSKASKQPFYRMKIRLKKEIVTLGQPGISPTKKVGQYLTAQQWHKMLEDPDVIVVDTRNDYEVKLGTFHDALNPQTKTFREFPDYVKKNLSQYKTKKVLMCCTGGIRCEKSTSYLLEQGFSKVYHLKDGILKYLEEIPEDQSKWSGECFVFDQRVSVTHGLKEGKASLCYACQAPLTAENLLEATYEEGISCSYCYGKRSDEQVASARERQKQQKLAAQRGEQHMGQKLDRHKAK